MNIEEKAKYIINKLREHVDCPVIGVSGGADSTLVTCLCVEAFGPKNVYCLHMPYSNKDFDGNKFNAKSLQLTGHLEVNSKLISIGDSVNTMSKNFNCSVLNEGNMRSRMRMIALYTYNCQLSEQCDDDLRFRVMGTGNLSEDFIGYDTKGGDALADIFPIGELYKSEVYEMLDYFVNKGLILDTMIDRIPSAGLWDDQTDEDELGYTYNEMEPVIRHFRKYNEWPEPNSIITQFVMNRHYDNKHKHMAPLVIGFPLELLTITF